MPIHLLWTNSYLSASMAPPSKRSEKTRGRQKGRYQSTCSYMYLLSWDRMQSLLPYFQTTSAVVTQEWNGTQVLLKEHFPPPSSCVLANLGIGASQAPCTEIHLQRMWAESLDPQKLEFWLVPKVSEVVIAPEPQGVFLLGTLHPQFLGPNRSFWDRQAGRCRRKWFSFSLNQRTFIIQLNFYHLLYAISLLNFGHYIHPSMDVLFADTHSLPSMCPISSLGSSHGLPAHYCQVSTSQTML